MSDIQTEFIAEQETLFSIGQIDIGTDDVSVRPLHDSIAIVIANSQSVTHGIVSTVNIDVVTVIEHRAQRFTHPIGVHPPDDFSQTFVVKFLQNNVVLGRDVGFINWGASETLDILGVDYSFIDRETYHVGETAIKMLLERIDNPNLPQRINVLPPKIVLGDYCRSY